MTVARQRLGQTAESIVVRDLERRGMRVLARNVRAAGVRGEIDVIALEGQALVFVEVKALRSSVLAGPERPAMAVGPRKQRKLRSLALAWLREHSPPAHSALRFDVVGVRLDAHDRVTEWEHIRAAF